MSLWIIIDIVVIAIYVLSVLYFKTKGFLNASETIFSLILSFCLVPTLLPSFEGIIGDSVIGQGVYDKVEEFIVGDDKGKEVALPDQIQGGLDEQLAILDKTKNDFMDITVKYVSEWIIKIISFVILFILAKLAIFVIFRILNLVCHVKLFGFVNKTLGVILGLINGTIMVYIICALAVAFVPIEHSSTFKDAISDTIITQFFYNNNVIINFFM